MSSNSVNRFQILEWVTSYQYTANAGIAYKAGLNEYFLHGNKNDPVRKMINFSDVTGENTIEHNPTWP